MATRQSYQTLANVNSGATQQLIVTMPQQGRTYFYRVQAFGKDGASGFSDAISLFVP